MPILKSIWGYAMFIAETLYEYKKSKYFRSL